MKYSIQKDRIHSLNRFKEAEGMTEIRTNFSDIKFKENGKLKLLIILGTRPEIIRLAAVINKCRKYFDVILAHTGQNYASLNFMKKNLL